MLQNSLIKVLLFLVCQLESRPKIYEKLSQRAILTDKLQYHLSQTAERNCSLLKALSRINFHTVSLTLWKKKKLQSLRTFFANPYFLIVLGIHSQKTVILLSKHELGTLSRFMLWICPFFLSDMLALNKVELYTLQEKIMFVPFTPCQIIILCTSIAFFILGSQSRFQTLLIP